MSDSDDTEDDDYNSNYVGFQVTTKNDTIAAVTTDSTTNDVTRTDFEDVVDCENQNFESCKESDSDISDEEELSTEDIQEAY